MAKTTINLISLSGNTFKDIGLEGIFNLLAVNTDNEDITLDLAIGPKTLHNKTSETGAFYVLKQIPIPTGSTFSFDGDTILAGAGQVESIITEYKTIKSRFEEVKNFTFLIRVGSGHTANVVLRR
jgi:hypothetical protein|tara:strand:+ start:683 stop:1057 length:375 start_codon:yes stop_codon:yes gene_type:complete